jgi:hypothetical protein
MSDVAGSTTRHPGHHTDWKFPYAHIIWRAQDGSCLMVYEENGKNTILMSHGVSGTYTEINNSGDMVNFCVGHVANYGKSGTSFTVDNNGDIKFGGHSRILVGGGSHIEVAGHAGVVVGGDTAVVGMGKINARAKSVYLGSDGDISINASGNMEIKAAGTMHLKAATIRHNSSGGFGEGGATS